VRAVPGAGEKAEELCRSNDQPVQMRRQLSVAGMVNAIWWAVPVVVVYLCTVYQLIRHEQTMGAPHGQGMGGSLVAGEQHATASRWSDLAPTMGAGGEDRCLRLWLGWLHPRVLPGGAGDLW